MQRIDPKIEEPTRTLLGHAMRGELEDLANLIYTIGDERYLECTALCVTVTAYVAIDACRMQWPGDADLREIARHAAATTKRFDLDAAPVYEFLSRVVFGAEKLDQVFPDLGQAGAMPVLATARVLVSFCPREMEWWEYLNQIEGATEEAGALQSAVLPALMYGVRSRQIRTATT